MLIVKLMTRCIERISRISARSTFLVLGTGRRHWQGRGESEFVALAVENGRTTKGGNKKLAVFPRGAINRDRRAREPELVSHVASVDHAK